MSNYNQLIESRWNTLRAAALGSLIGLSPINTAAQQNISNTPVKSIEQTKNQLDPKNVEFVKMAMDYIKGNEGVIYTKKPDLSGKPGTYVIGVGHVLLPGEKFNTLSPLEVDKLFKKDLVLHKAKINKLLPKYNTYPNLVRVALLDSIFRGEKSPKTFELIRRNQWTLAAKEYLNNDEYRDAKAGIKNPGVATRMEKNARIFAQHGKDTGT